MIPEGGPEEQFQRLQTQDQQQHTTSWFALCPRECCLLTPSPRAPEEAEPAAPPAWASKAGSPHCFGNSNQCWVHSLQKHPLLCSTQPSGSAPVLHYALGSERRRGMWDTHHICVCDLGQEVREAVPIIELKATDGCSHTSSCYH